MGDLAFTNQLHKDFEALRTGALDRLGLTPLKPCILGRRVEFFDTSEAVEDALRESLSGLCAGWVRRESWAGRVDQTPGDPGGDTGGVMLEGEWAVTPTTSLSLLYDGRRWRLITLTEGDEDGTPALREDTQLIGRQGEELNYAVYWGDPKTDQVVYRARPQTDQSATRRFAARLIGIGEATP